MNAADYGATPGSGDNTSALQSWLTALGTSGGWGYIGPGNYNHTGVSLTIGTKRVKLSGAGQQTTLTNTSTGTGSTAKAALYVNGGRLSNGPGQCWLELDSLSFVGSSVGGPGLYLDAVGQATISNVYAAGFTSSSWDVGIWLNNCLDCVLVNPVSRLNGVGLYMSGGSNANNANQVVGGWIRENTRYGWQIQSGSTTCRSNNAFGTIFEQNSGPGVSISGANMEGCGLWGCWIESNGTPGLQIDAASFVCDGTTFANELSAMIHVGGSHAANVSIRSPSFLTSSHVIIDSGATNVTLWDASGTVAVTDNSGGQFKQIRSYLLTGG